MKGTVTNISVSGESIMSKKLGIWLVISGVTLVTELTWLALNLRGPFYQGKSLSFWLEAYAAVAVKGPSPEWQRAEDAVRHAGTRAIPTLLRMVRGADSSLQDKECKSV